MKNLWLIEKIEDWENRKAHGSLIIHFNDGDARSIEKNERENKPKTNLNNGKGNDESF